MVTENSRSGRSPGGVLISGASRGIGLACGLALSRRGWSVVGTSRRPEHYEDLKEMISREGLDFHLIRMDVCDDQSVSGGVARAVELLGGLKAVVANAGCAVFGPLEEIPIEWVQVQYETNLLGVIRVIREAIPLMREEGGGTIVVAGSLASRIHLPFQSHYTASKAALVGLCASLRMELRPFGIRVHLVEPTDINTTLGENRKIFIKEGSPYEERARRCLRVTEEAEMKAEPPDVVARLVVDIIEGRRNAGRKVVGRRARLYSMLRAVLPTGMAEGMISLHFET